VGDICKLIPDSDADFCILEEPEHLNWIRGEGEGEIWTEKFKRKLTCFPTDAEPPWSPATFVMRLTTIHFYSDYRRGWSDSYELQGTYYVADDTRLPVMLIQNES
jgi:hypothetical protein